MNKIPFLCAAMTMLAVIAATAHQPAPQTPARPDVPLQPALQMLGMASPKSPEVALDGAVTFRLKAPDTSAVGVSGNWQAGMMAPPLPMNKGADGVIYGEEAEGHRAWVGKSKTDAGTPGEPFP